ncbi:hypothetical protein VAC51_00047 [Variovorax phage VAC_51]|uniref:Uncharacterized protein n=1 Tax=Variovorax phage VAC_51 TaxID=2985242 RepID=A0A9N6WSB8_9CAUD|nr:hypothetical protein VAC51_00047 [Variovorax phage VAC_51]
MSAANAPIPGHMTWAEGQAIIVQLRRKVMAAMETGNEGVARTIITELREYDFDAANKLRAEVVKNYGTDI